MTRELQSVFVGLAISAAIFLILHDAHYKRRREQLDEAFMEGFETRLQAVEKIVRGKHRL